MPSKEATPAFFRVVPGDYIQGPDGRELHDQARVRRTSSLFDFQEPYSQGLADAAELVLKAKGVTTTRQSVANTVTDFSSFVTKVPSNADFVFFPTQKPGDAQNFAQQLIEQGKKAKVFGGDGSNDAVAVQGAGLVRLELRSGHQRLRVQQGDHRRLEEGQPGKAARLVRPAALPRRAGRAQRDQEGVRRRQGSDQGSPRRRAQRQADLVKNSILGGDFRFSTKSNDPLNAKFYIFEIQSNGSYKLVG